VRGGGVVAEAGPLAVEVLRFVGGGVALLIVIGGIVLGRRWPITGQTVVRLTPRQLRRNEAVAARLGLTFSPEDRFGLLALPLTLLSWGWRRWTGHVFTGQWRGREVYLFRFFYEVPGGKHGPQVASRMAAVTSIDASFPHVVLEHRGLWEFGQVIHGAERVSLDAEFDDRYRVITTDPSFVRELIDTNFRRWLLSLDHRWRFELSGPWVLAYQEPEQGRVDHRGYLDMVADLADRVPWILSQQRPPGSGPDPDPLPVGPAPPTERQLQGRRRARTVVLGVLAAIALFAGAAVVVNAVHGSGDDRVACEGCRTPQASPLPVGGSAVLRGQTPGERVEVTLVRVQDPAHPTGLFGPGPGNRLVGAELRLRNVGSHRYRDAPSNGAVLVAESGTRIKASLIDAVEPSLGTVSLAPGVSRAGFVSFEVPKGDPIAELRVRLDSGFGPETGIWLIAA
jgi:hypothetical protein